MGRLEGKRAIVTGAGSGIGRASALLFAREGAAVLAVDKTRDTVEETAKQIAAAGGKAVAMAADAGNEPEVQAYVARALAEFGGLLRQRPGDRGGRRLVEHASVPAPAALMRPLN